ncbi:hypothetical protein F444_10927, partial [Phytophthora nicotianae P1976]
IRDGLPCVCALERGLDQNGRGVAPTATLSQAMQRTCQSPPQAPAHP